MVGRSHFVSLCDSLFITTIQSKKHIAYSYPYTWSKFSRQVVHGYSKHVSLIQFDFCRSPLTTHMIAIRYEFETPISKLGTNFESEK